MRVETMGQRSLAQRLILTLCTVAFLVLPGRAALEAEADTPYRLHVVLWLQDNPLFTPVFQARIQREIRDSFAAALGDLGLVEVHDGRDLLSGKVPPTPVLARLRDLLRDVEHLGLDRALEGSHKLSQSKAHFVTIEFRDGFYVIRARQVDGMTGLASPLVRETRTNDRELVARSACLVMQRDFGVVGTIDPANVSADEATIVLQAGRRHGSFVNWLSKGDVMAISRIREERGGQYGDRVEWALLQTAEEVKDGKCRCRLLSRFKDPLRPAPSVSGYRCMRLGTAMARVALRLVDERLDSIPSLRVTFAADSFNAKSDDEGSTDAYGLIESAKAYRNVVFLQAYSESLLRARIPMEVLGEGRVAVCVLPSDRQGELMGHLRADISHFIDLLNENLLAGDELTRELNEIGDAKHREEALQKAEKAHERSQKELAAFRTDLATLRARWQESGSAGQGPWAEVEEFISALERKNNHLERYMADLRKVIAEENDPLRAALLEKLAKAGGLEEAAEFDAALRLYEEAIQDAKDKKLVQKYIAHVDQLKKAWAIKDENHRRARAFIYDVWPKADSEAELSGHMDDAFKALQACQAAGDRLTPQRLLKANTTHFNRNTKLLTKLRNSTDAESVAQSKRIIEVQKNLEKLRTKAAAAVGAPGGK
jgi:hypothetical protein